MNFKRGFFRLWVLLSALFIVGVAVVSYRDVSEEFEKASMDFSSVGTLLVPIDCKGARGTAGTDYEAAHLDGSANKPICWYKMPDFRRLFPEYKGQSDDSVSYKLYASAGLETHPARPWSALLIAASIAIAGPAITLFLGTALGWALLGFVPKPK
ncbi:hypothetical protein [Bradyrhizobium oligotrophicum]|uniref:hypothetical protein n=1 Tax=Bradyrhizobium oligotrophicum TaxID=44255 RepID=UPI003EBFD989